MFFKASTVKTLSVLLSIIFLSSFKSDNQSGEIRQYITPKENVNFKVELLDFTKEKNF